MISVVIFGNIVFLPQGALNKRVPQMDVRRAPFSSIFFVACNYRLHTVGGVLTKDNPLGSSNLVSIVMS